jgi:hypothetical protein
MTRDYPNKIINLEQSNVIMAAMEVGLIIARDYPNNIIYLDQSGAIMVSMAVKFNSNEIVAVKLLSGPVKHNYGGCVGA